MRNTTEKFGSCQKVLVDRYSWLLIVSFLLLFAPLSIGQTKTSITLQEALLDLAKSERLSIVFSSRIIPEKPVVPLSGNASLQDKLSHLLDGSDLYYRIENGQIFLFKKHRIYGFVEDKESGERLISATLYLPSSGRYELTNTYGYYSLLSTEDSLELEVSYVGYRTQTLLLDADELDQELIIGLEQDSDLTEVVISDKLISKDDRKYIELDKGSDILLTQQQAISSLGGEPDIFQALTRQSGISSGADGIGGIHVRGGKNDQNLILLDGVKLYNSAHAFGMFSIANSTLVDQVRLYKTGASRESSGRLSSVVDVITKTPDLNTVKGSAQVSTLAGQATLEIPLVKDRMGILVSGRRTYIDPYVNHVTDKNFYDMDIQGSTSYGFHDFNLKVFGKMDSRNRFFLSAYQGRDVYSSKYDADLLEYEPPLFVDEDIRYSWENRFVSGGWNTLVGNSSFMNIQVSAYEYDYDNVFDVDEYDEFFIESPSYSQFSTFNAQTTDYSIKLDVETVLENHHLKYGVNASHTSYQIGEYLDTIVEAAQPVFLDLDMNNLSLSKYLGYSNEEVTLYISNKVKISNRWLLEGGIYQTMHRTKDDDISISPIFGTATYIKTLHKVNNAIYIGGSIGSYIQTEHLLTIADNGYPNDIWVPSTDIVPFQRSNQMEIFSEVDEGIHRLRLSSYFKRQSGILRSPFDAELPGLADIFSLSWETDVQLGTAKGFGIEVDYSLELEDGVQFKGAYTYAKMDYHFEGINGGKSFPFDYSLPHTLSLAGTIRMYKDWRLILDWFYASGKPFTLYESSTEYTPLDLNGLSDEFALTDENARRLPDVHKLSIMLNTQWKWSKVQNHFSIGIQNLYDHRNVILQYQLEGEGIRSQRSFPILPMILWRIGF